VRRWSSDPTNPATIYAGPGDFGGSLSFLDAHDGLWRFDRFRRNLDAPH